MIGNYREIVTHCEKCLQRHGDNHRGVDWPNASDAQTRYRIMLEVIRAAARMDFPTAYIDRMLGEITRLS